jgi:hypothetical protein
MNRELKFRAWFKPNDYDGEEPKKLPRMIYFDELGYCDEYNHLKFQLAKESHDPEGGDYCNLSASEDNFLAVMQFTGVRDNNHKDLYEGDVVEVGIEQLFDCVAKTGVIEFNEVDARWDVMFPDDGVSVALGGLEDIEWRGTKHENPELAK